MYHFVYIFLILYGFNLCQCFEEEWKTREELVITNITAVENFKLDARVRKWSSLSTGSKCYSVGLMDTGLVILLSTSNPNETTFNVKTEVIELPQTPIEAILMEHNQMEAILIVAFQYQRELKWYRILETELKPIWTWNLVRPVTHVNAFTVNKKPVLLLASVYGQNYTSVDLYQYDPNSFKNHWYWHSLNVSTPVSSSAFTRYESNSFVSLPQKPSGTVVVYKLQDIFKRYKTISSTDVENVLSFEVGSESFLALDGANAGVYKFGKYELVREELLDGMQYWLPVPLKTYRDDVVVFAQRTVDYTSHSGHVVEVFTYDGVQFVEHEDVPCTHFGEQSLWLACLTERGGIKGASYILAGGRLGLVVPRLDNSLLFMINFTIEDVSDPLELELRKLLAEKHRLQELIESQTKRKAQILSQRSESDELYEQLVAVGKDIRDVGGQVERIIAKQFDVLTINGTVHIDEGEFEIVHVEEIGAEPATKLLDGLVRKDSIQSGRITGEKIFNDLHVQDISFEKVNGIQAGDIVLKSDAKIHLTGNVTVHGTTDVGNVTTGTVNGIDLTDEIVDMGKEYVGGFIKFEDVEIYNRFDVGEVNATNSLDSFERYDSTITLENLNVTKINGEDFDMLLNQLCMVNVKCYIPGHVKVNGTVTAGKASAEFLNDLKFPNEFVLNEPGHITTYITGRKTFGNLTAIEVKTTGSVDGIDTRKVVTLSSDQKNFTGKITFKDIEVAERLHVGGKILGEHIEKFLPNPTLEYARNIAAKVNFKRIEVVGDVIVNGNFNGNNLRTTLDEAVYKDEASVGILAPKQFPEGFTVNDLAIASNSINDVPLDSIVTKNTDQILDVSVLNGHVLIEQAEVGKSFNGQNVTQLDEELVKLASEQYIESTLIFNDLEAASVEVTGRLNNIDVEEFTFVDDENLDRLSFSGIEAVNVTVEGDFNGIIPEFDIKDLNERYLSYARDQTIGKHYDIFQSTIDYLEATRVNGENYNDYFNRNKFDDKIRAKLKSGEFRISELLIAGFLQVESMNGRKSEAWLPSEQLFEANGKYKKDLVVEDNAFFNDLHIDKLGGVNWLWYNEQLIRKDEATTQITAPVVNFLAGIKVGKLVETKRINGVPIEDILTKQGEQVINGPITINGDLYFESNTSIADSLNAVPIGEILSGLDIVQSVCYVTGDVAFTQPSRIHNLTVLGLVNDRNVSELLSQAVLVDKDATLTEGITFEEPVEILGNLAVRNHLNGVNVSDLANQVVLITSDTEIRSLVAFHEPVVVMEELTIGGELTTSTLYGVDLEEWKANSVYLNDGLVQGSFGFDQIEINDNLEAKYLNDIDTSTIIRLGTDEVIDYLEIGEATTTRHVPVLGAVNGYDNLTRELERTVMGNSDQVIESDITFKDVVVVRENLTGASINGKDATKIVTTDTDQNLTSKFAFKSQCKIDKNLHVHGLINGINLTVWQRKNLKIHSPVVQEVYEDWSVTNTVSFDKAVEGNALINDLNLTSVMKEVEDRRNFKYKVEYGIIRDYEGMCTDVWYLYEAAKKQIYKFQYFEELQTIIFRKRLQSVHYFQYKRKQYLLVNEDGCTSQLLVFNTTVFEHLETVTTGHITQAVTVQANDNLYLVTRHDNVGYSCNINGTYVWRFDGEILELYYKIEDQALLQESVVPYTFYGLSNEGVTEFKVDYIIPRTYRKWKVSESNAAFVPRGLKTGLALRTGHKLVFLDRSNTLVEEFSTDVESVIIGNTSEVSNSFIPGRDGGDLVVARVGVRSASKNLLAVATHEETSVKGRLDFVKIYSDVLKGNMFHKVAADTPSSLISIEFDQGETLLVFIENERTLQVYEYKGIEGFKHRSSAKIEASKLFLMTLPIEPYLNPRKALGVVHKNKITVIQAVMAGNRIREDLKCGL